MTPQTQHFLSGIHNPVNASNLITALAAGTPLQVDCIPVDALPTVTLLAVIGMRRYNQQIVDNYVALLHRMAHVIDSADYTRTVPDTGERFNHPQFHLISSLLYQCMEDERGAAWIDNFPEARYMDAVYQELVNTELTALFAVEKRKK